MKEKQPPAQMLRAAAAALPIEDAAMRQALAALAKAIEAQAVPEWRLVHLKTAQNLLEIAEYTACREATTEWDNEGWGKNE